MSDRPQETVEEFRLRARAWLKENMPPRPDVYVYGEDWDTPRVLQKKLFDGGFAGVCFPAEYGGLGLGYEYQQALTEESIPYEMPWALNSPTLGIIAPTILDFGTEEQKKRFLPKILSGEEVWVQFLSEPTGGSDLASVTTRATLDGDHYVVNGSKIWSTGAHAADYAICVARSDWGVPKHDGITVLMMKIHEPGVTVEQIVDSAGGVEFCQEFFDDVRVPAANVLGEPEKGWTVVRGLLAHERTSGGHGSIYTSGHSPRTNMRTESAMLHLARESGRTGDPRVREAVGEDYTLDFVQDALSERIVRAMEKGQAAAQRQRAAAPGGRLLPHAQDRPDALRGGSRRGGLAGEHQRLRGRHRRSGAAAVGHRRRHVGDGPERHQRAASGHAARAGGGPGGSLRPGPPQHRPHPQELKGAVGGAPRSSGGGRLGNAFSSLQIPAFRWLLGGNSAYFMSSSGQALVRPFLAYHLTDSALALGIVTFSMAVPMLVLSPVGGALADRFERRRMIALAQFVGVCAEATLLALLLLDRLEYWHLVASTFVLGCSFPMSSPARSSIVMNLVGRAELGNAVALNMSAQNVTRVVGPALAGFLIPAVGIAGALAFNFSLNLLSLITVLRVPRFEPPRELRAISIHQNLMGGFHYVFENRLVLILLLYGLVPLFLATPFHSLLVVFTEDVWHTGPRGLGIINSTIGAGGVAGSIFIATRSPGAGRQRLMIASALVFGGALAGAAFSPWFGLALLLVFVGNGCAAAFTTLNNTAIQLLIPDSVRGRVSSFLMMSFSVPMLGTLPVSAAAEAFGAPLAVGVASALALVFTLGFYLLSRQSASTRCPRRARAMRDDP